MKKLEKLEEKFEALRKEIEDLKKKEERPITWLEFEYDDDLCEKYMMEPEWLRGFDSVWQHNDSKYKALRKLELLCKSWGGGYGKEYSIFYRSNSFIAEWTPTGSWVISFDDRSDANLFLKTFIGLFQEAKELL